LKAIALYHPKSEHSGQVEDLRRDYKRQKNKELELVSLETVEGSETARLYDVTSYPAVLVLTNDGRLIKFWQGELPPLSELAGYIQE
jgi:thioredoxin-like negative regulator of GroEL